MSAIPRNAVCPCGSGAKYKKCCLTKNETDLKPHSNEDAVLILQPTRGQIAYEAQVGIEQNMGAKYAVIRVARKPVVEARNLLAAEALRAWRKNVFAFTPRETFVLWLDDDALILPGLVPNMLRAMREPSMKDVDALFGWFCGRTPFGAPIAYRDAAVSDSYPRVGIDCRPGEIVDIDCAGFHAVLMRPRLLERLGPNPFTLTNDLGEDIAFCRRARAIGARLTVGTAFVVPHLDPRDGLAYVPGMPTMITDGNSLRQITMDHLGADGSQKTTQQRAYGAKLDDLYDEQRVESAKILTEIEQRRAISAV